MQPFDTWYGHWLKSKSYFIHIREKVRDIKWERKELQKLSVQMDVRNLV